MEIRLDFISADSLASKGSVEKIDFILRRIKDNVIIVLEEGLTPKEEAELIEATMREIDVENFHGIEFYRIDHKATRLRDKIANYIAGKKAGLTILGPTRVVEAIKREPDYISMLARGEASQTEEEIRPTSAPDAEKSTRKARKQS